MQFGVSFTISGLRVQRADRVEQRGGLPRVGAHDHAGLDVRAGDVELERGDLVALGERRHELGDLLAREAHDVDDQRHRQLGELRQVVLEVAGEALVGQADRVDHARRRAPTAAAAGCPGAARA